MDASSQFPSASDLPDLGFVPSSGIVSQSLGSDILTIAAKEVASPLATSLGADLDELLVTSPAFADLAQSALGAEALDRINAIVAGNELGGITVDEFRDVFSEDGIGAIAGGNRPILPGSPVPPDEIGLPTLEAALNNDTGASAFDGITSDGTLAGVVADESEVGLLRVGSDGAFTSVEVQPDGSFVVDLNAVAPDANGAVELTVQAFDEFGNRQDLPVGFTFDVSAPGVTLPSPTRKELTVSFSGPVSAAAFEVGSYEFVDASGNEIALAAAEQLSDRAVSLEFAEILPPSGSYTLELLAAVSDIAGNEIPAGTTFDLFIQALPLEVAPANGEVEVPLVRETVIEFPDAVDPATITAESVQLMALGEQLSGELVVSSTGESVRFFPDAPLPASTQVQIQVDGDLILDLDGDNIDADGDGALGGMLVTNFQTVSSTRISGTNIFGSIFDSNNLNPDGSNIPVVGARVEVIGQPEIFAITDENGFFELEDLPASEIFVAIDSSEATSSALTDAGDFYLSIEERYETVAGEAIPLTQDGRELDVFLPLVNRNDFTPISATEATTVGLGDEALGVLTELFPDVPVETLDRLEVTIQPDSLSFDDDDRSVEGVTIVALPPDRVPSPPLAGTNPSFIITVEADGARNIDNTANLVFPNVDGLTPGEQRFIFGFDHDAGEWVTTGTATVSEDGTVLISDEDAGVQTLGWRYIAPNPGVIDDRSIDDAFPGTDDGDADDSPPEEDEVTTYRVGISVDSEFVPLTVALDASLVFDIPVPSIDSFEFEFSESLSFPEDPIQFGEEFSATFSVPTDSIINLLIPEISFNLFNLDLALGLQGTATIGGNLGLEADFDENEVEAEIDIGVGANVSAFASAEISDSFICDIPIAGDFICQPRTFSVPIAGTPTFEFDVEAEIPGINLQDFEENGELEFSIFEAEAMAQLTASTSVSFSPRVFIEEIDTSLGIESSSTFLPNELRSLNENTSSLMTSSDDFENRLSDVDGFGSDSQSFYRYTFPSGFDIFGRTSITGEISEILPANSEFSLVVYSPRTNRYEVLSGITGAAGSVTSSITVLSEFGGLDTDSDGIPDFGEFAIGTSVDQPDTDGDGISDAAEVAQDLDPLGGQGFPTGIVGSLPLVGEALEVVVEGSISAPGEQTAFIATGSQGLALVDVSQFSNPIALGKLDLPGENTDVTVDSVNNLAVLAGGTAGIHIVDVSNPMLPVLQATIPTAAPTERIELNNGLIYAASGENLVVVDLFSGDILQELSLDSTVNDIAREGNTLYAVTAGDRLQVIDISSTNAIPLGAIDTPTFAARRIFVGNGIAYVANGVENDSISIPNPSQRGGYATFDVSDPNAPILISDIDTPEVQAGNLQTVTNGSGLALVAGGFRGLELHNASDDATTYDLITAFETPGTARSVAVSGGIAFVADDVAGLQVINYSAFDSNGIAPTAAIDSLGSDLDPAAPGVQILETTATPIQATVTDDVQVRDVTLIVNGEEILTDTSFPFDLSFVPAVVAPGSGTIEVQVRATDTGGNSTLSNLLTFDVVEDTFAPAVVSTTPPDGSAALNLSEIVVAFDEAIDDTLIGLEDLTLLNLGDDGAIGGGDDVEVEIASLSVVQGQQLAIGLGDALPEGNYQLSISAAAISDLAGNTLESPFLLDFTSTIDPGSTPAEALDVGSLGAQQVFSDSLDPDDQADYYQFTLNSPSSINITLNNSGPFNADLQLVQDVNGNGLFDNGELVFNPSGNAVENTDDLTLDSGTYFALVAGGNFATDYTLSLAATAIEVNPASDPGDTPGDAFDIGALGVEQTFNGLLGLTDGADYYQFTLDSPSSLNITLSNNGPFNADLQLVQDINGDGVFSNGELVFNPSGNTVENIDSLLLDSGTYFALVSSNNFVADYTLSLAATVIEVNPASDPGDTPGNAFDIGALGVEQTFNGLLSLTDEADYYQFTLNSPSSINITLNNGGPFNADLQLVQDVNGNGLFDNGELVFNPFGNAVENIDSLLLDSGTYFALVSSNNFVADYTLSLSATAIEVNPAIDPGDTPGDAFDIGVLGVEQTFNGLLGLTDEADYYQFTLDSPGSINITLNNGGPFDADLQLVQDVNSNGFFDNGELVFNPFGNIVENIDSLLLDSGTYFALVSSNNFVADYTLSLAATAIEVNPASDPGDTPGDAFDIGVLGVEQTFNGLLSLTDEADYYQFTLDSPSSINITLNNGGLFNADLQLVQDVNDDGLFDNGELVFNPSGNTVENIDSLLLDSGTYFALVSSNNLVADYTLSLAATAIEVSPEIDPGDTPGNAFDIGALGVEQTFNGLLGLTDEADYYQFTLDSPSSINITLNNGGPFNADLQLVQDVNGNGLFDNGELVFNPSGNIVENIDSLLLDSGTYFALVSSSNFVADYTLSLAATAIEVNPAIDPGDTPGDAFDIGVLGAEQTFNGLLGLTDEADYYQFTLDSPSSINIILNNSGLFNADLQLVQDINGNGLFDNGELVFNPSGNTVENIDALPLDPGTYFALVSSNNFVADYTLSLTATNAGTIVATNLTTIVGVEVVGVDIPSLMAGSSQVQEEALNRAATAV